MLSRIPSSCNNIRMIFYHLCFDINIEKNILYELNLIIYYNEKNNCNIKPSSILGDVSFFKPCYFTTLVSIKYSYIFI